MEKKLSPKKIEANRRNAQRSTGPRTRAGKLNVRWNAVKHGLLSDEVVLPVDEVQERPEELARLVAHLRRDLRPRGALEEMLVEKIAVCYWRLRRALRCETGEIRRELATAGAYEMEASIHEATLASLVSGSPGVAQLRLVQHSWGLNYLIQVIEQVQREVEELGCLSRQAHERLRQNFGDHEDGLASRCLRLSPVDGPAAENAAAARPLLLEALEQKREKLERQRQSREQQEMREWEGRLASLSVPSKGAMERIVRYESSLHRELHRTIRQLGRLQRQRKGLGPWGAPQKLRNKAKQVV